MTTIAQNRQERVTVGVDTHKDTHAAVALDPVGRVIGKIEIEAGLKGYRRLLDGLGPWQRTCSSASREPAASGPASAGSWPSRVKR